MVKIGDEVVSLEMATITREILQEYAEAARDPNKIHLDDEVAKKVGLPGIIAHGMLIAAYMAERARKYNDTNLDGSWRMEKYKARFTNMTFLEDTITVGGKVKEVKDKMIVLELNAKDQKGEIKAGGVITLVHAS